MGDINDKFQIGTTKAEDVIKYRELIRKMNDSSTNVDDAVETEDIMENDELTKKEDDSSVSELVEKHDIPDDYKQDLVRSIEAEVQNIFNEEIKKAKQELITEHRKAITQIVQEHKSLLKELVEEEKQSILDKAVELKQSLLLHLSEELNNNNTQK